MHKSEFLFAQEFSEEKSYSAPGRSFVLDWLVVPKLLTAAGMTLDGDSTSANEKLYESVPSLLCNHPLFPENPSATIHVFLKPRLVSVLPTVFATSEYLRSSQSENDEKQT